MSMKRIISTFLVVLMLVSSLSLVISAEETSDTQAPVYEYNTSRVTSTMNYLTGEYERKDENGKVIETIIVDTQEEKLEVMDLRLEQDGYRLYVDEFSGEVAVECIATGDVLFTNPYDVGADSTISAKDKKSKMLSQFFIEYVDTSNNNQKGEYHSFRDAVKGGDYDSTGASQIEVKYIKNGLRVEYSIGRIDSRYLVPERISKEKFETEILNVAIEAGATAFEQNLLRSFFSLKDLEAHVALFTDPVKAQEQRADFLKRYPMAEKGPVYVFTGVTKREYKSIEAIIKKYCPDYTYEELDSEHLALNYSPADKNEALFKISLEYTIDENGLSVRVPANGIRFDETIYRLENLEVLPFMGAGSNPNSGYTFFPDGSGALFDFQDLADVIGDTWFHGSVYGQDFAFSSINSESPHNQTVRYPVFGLVEDTVDEEGNERSRGFVAVVEEGESLMKLSAYHTTQYNTVIMKINPRPYDTYKLSDAISTAGDAPLVVVSPRKYTGDFRIRYTMLTDPDVKTGEGYYDTSYVGMAKAYREYLIANGTLTKLTEEDVSEDIPLYIKTFGAIETTEKFLSIPYDTMKALTSFDDIRKMYDELSKSGVENINFVLSGYSKGGLSKDNMPYNLNWDKSVEKDMEFEELLQYAKDNNFGLYPDFDFVFVGDNDLFDGMSLTNHAVKTIDDRYTSKREYSATRQAFVNYFELAMSPAYFSRFYEHLTEDYAKTEPIGISVSSLGTYLNSDFDEDEPYHREDSKEFTTEAFQYLDAHYDKVMTSGGNVYSWKYVDYITDIAIDSSRHGRSSATVPFLGIVLHGYVQTAGTAINMEGNIDYAMLRAIENGSALQFVLSYKNTALLKENEDTSIYYSVRYDIWRNDLIERYHEINDALKDVQTSIIEEHSFIDGVRVPNADEIADDANNELFNAIYNEILEAADAKETLRVTLQNVRKYINEWNDYVGDNKNSAEYIYNNFVSTALASFKSAVADVEAAAAEVKALEDAVKAAEATPLPVDEAAGDEAAEGENAEEKEPTLEEKLATAKTEYETAVAKMKEAYDYYNDALSAAKAIAKEYIDKYEFATSNFDKLSENDVYTAGIIAELAVKLEAVESAYDKLVELAKQMDVANADVTAAETKYAEELGLNAEEAEKDEEDVATDEYNKYGASKNSIVYERYSNGKEFILNFNNYAVRVEVNGTYYTVEAYGYLII